jgi:hypothetical protein
MYIVPCVCCDDPVVIDIQFWQLDEYPVAVCDECLVWVPWQVLRAINSLRYKLYNIELNSGTPVQ